MLMDNLLRGRNMATQRVKTAQTQPSRSSPWAATTNRRIANCDKGCWGIEERGGRLISEMASGDVFLRRELLSWVPKDEKSVIWRAVRSLPGRKTWYEQWPWARRVCTFREPKMSLWLGIWNQWKVVKKITPNVFSLNPHDNLFGWVTISIPIL